MKRTEGTLNILLHEEMKGVKALAPRKSWSLLFFNGRGIHTLSVMPKLDDSDYIYICILS